MASLKLILFGAILAATNVLGDENKTTRNINVENKMSSVVISNNLNSKNNAAGILRKLLQPSRSCGVPNPKCTTGCFGETGCVCHQRQTGSYSYYIIPCRENSKICKVGEYKSYDYSKINPLHSASLPAKPTYNKIREGITKEEKQQIIDMHNNFRAKVARGGETRSSQQGVSQPSGSNIKELIWNDELAYIAQKWAVQFNFAHELESSRRAPCSRPYEGAGQNLYKSTRSWAYKANQWSTAIQAWYDEVADTPISIVNKYAWGVTKKQIGHYTQLVWADTYEVGCGAVYFSGGMYESGSTTLYVCNYGPPGNMIGVEIYKIGRPAAHCGKSGKSIKYPGLCATTL